MRAREHGYESYHHDHVLPFCFLAASSPPKQGEALRLAEPKTNGSPSPAAADGDGMGIGSAPPAAAAAVAVALKLMCLFLEDVETKTDFPLRGATAAAALESPAVRRLRRSAAVAAAAADDDDAVDGDVVEAFLWNRELMVGLILPEMYKNTMKCLV